MFTTIPMDKAHVEHIKAVIKQRTEELVAQGPEACRDYLVKLGIYNADGTLHKNYGGI